MIINFVMPEANRKH